MDLEKKSKQDLGTSSGSLSDQMSLVSNDFLSKIDKFNKMADETKELVKQSFGLKSKSNVTTSSAINNNTSSFISVKAPSLPVELKLDEPEIKPIRPVLAESPK